MKPISIYIVEDELLISASLKSQLQNFGYEILGSSSRGESCIEEIELLSSSGKEPEIVLMDIHLRGELDGIETAKRINEKFKCAIIFLTGQSSKEVYERSFKIKPFGYLLKPIDMEQTKMTIEIAAYQRNLEIENETYQKSLEKLLEIRTSEKKEIVYLYQTIIENSLVGHAILQDEKFVFLNKRIAEIFDLSAEDFQALSFSHLIEIMPPADQLKMAELTRKCLNEEADCEDIRVKIFTRAGNLRQLQIKPRVVEYKGKPALHQTIIDITELLKSE